MAIGTQKEAGDPMRALGKFLKHRWKAFRADSSKAKKKTLSRAEFEADQASFEEWRARNPSKSVKAFYSERKQGQIAEGATQSTFGANLKSGPFEKEGIRFFEDLVGFGLQPSGTCVDYGCGTLRVGQHVIRYLAPGRYWGFDIADWLLEEGKGLIGSELVAEKKPQLRVISGEAVREAATHTPDMLFSVKVLQHVHPTELAEFFENVMTIIGTSGQAIISGKWSDGETVQYRINGWAHSMRIISDLVWKMDGKIEILNPGTQPLPLEGAGLASKGIIRIVHKASPRASDLPSR